MSLRINHNIAAINANRNLKLTTTAMNKSMQKLSSGFRINQAADDPAGLVISEQFRSQIAGLNRAIQNNEGSISMIQTAEGALTEINNLLISMRELAIHAANEGFNDADQLAADQAEIENAIKTVDRIAANTQFGTKKILDGSKDNIATITSSNTSELTVRRSNLTDGTHSVTITKTAEASASLNTTSLGLSLQNTDGDPYNLEEKIHNVDVVQASDVAKKRSDAITLTDAFGNGLQVNTASAVATINATATSGAVQASTAGTYNVVINYQENGESPTGNQTLTVTIAESDTQEDVVGKLNTQVALNSSLSGKVVFATAGAEIALQTANAGAQYSVQTGASTKVSGGTDGVEYFAFTTGSKRGVSDDGLNLTVNTEANGNTNAQIQLSATTYTSYSQLVDDINTALASSTAFATISGGVNDIEAFLVDSNRIEFRTKDEGSNYSIQVLADDGDTTTGNLRHALNLSNDTLAVRGTDAIIRFDNYTNTIDKVAYATTQNVTLYTGDSDDANRGSIDMVVAKASTGIDVGNLLLDVEAAKFDVRLDGGPSQSVTAGFDSTVYNADRSESLLLNIGLTSTGGSETINNTDQSLVFQIGANVGQTASIGVRDMSASSLGKNIAGNTFRSLSEIDVTTVQGAQDAQTIIDAAINEVSTTRGTLGSFQKNTLESNLRNLRVAAQNLSASESMIRDTDMAEEMSEFTKNQILVQAGTAMLAQANQVPQTVLSLF
ncbi:hypothetical protein GF420_12105 [candidate division GN15 bacterium]|nr:hypothetical protein [candidate division GN15 bacterium]